jgi:hypothetical protein
LDMWLLRYSLIYLIALMVIVLLGPISCTGRLSTLAILGNLQTSLTPCITYNYNTNPQSSYVDVTSLSIQSERLRLIELIVAESGI